MSDFNGFQSPNYTQAPNEFFDELLAQIDTMSELKVTLAAIRQTFGWHRTEAEMSVGFLEKATRMSRNSVRQGIALAIERGTLIEVRPETNRDGAVYAMVMSDDVARQTVGGSIFEGQKVTPTTRDAKIAPPRGAEFASQKVTPNKEIVLKEMKEKDVPAEKPKQETPVKNAPESDPKKTRLQSLLKQTFHFAFDAEWDWLDALLLEIPDLDFLTAHIERTRAAQSNALLDQPNFLRTARFQYARSRMQKQGAAP